MNTDPPYNVRVEPRSKNAIAAGNSSFTQFHHQKLDLVRHREKSRPTTRKLRPKDRPLENEFVTSVEFEELLRAWFENKARVFLPGRAFYIWGGFATADPHTFETEVRDGFLDIEFVKHVENPTIFAIEVEWVK